jgi:hypothetical protein
MNKPLSETHPSLIGLPYALMPEIYANSVQSKVTNELITINASRDVHICIPIDAVIRSQRDVQKILDAFNRFCEDSGLGNSWDVEKESFKKELNL